MSSGREASVIPLKAPLLSAIESSSSTMRTQAFVLSLVMIFIIPWEGVEVSSLGGLVKYVGYLSAGFWLATILRTGHVRTPKAFQVAVLAFALWNTLSVLWSESPDETLSRAFTWAQLFVFVTMLWDLYTTRTALMAGLQAYVLGAYVSVGSAIINYFGNAAFYTNYSRFSQGDTNPDGFGFILALGMPVAWYLASSNSTSKLGKVLRVLNFAYIPVAFLGISLSGTRTALIATIPAMAFGLSSLMRLHRFARIAILMVLGVMLLIVLQHVQDLKSFQRFGTTTSELTEGNLNNRTSNWLEGLAAFQKRPLMGVGCNMYRSVNRLGKVAHNSYLSVLVEVGLIGFILFGTILAIVLAHALRQSGWDRSFWLTQLAVWSLGAFMLTWEYRKSTWLFFSLVIAGAMLTRTHDDSAAAPHGRALGRWMQP